MLNRKGFTLVEIGVVLLILALLAAVAFPTYAWYYQRARMQTMLTIAASTNKAVLMYAVETGNLNGLSVPPDGGEIVASEGTLGVALPKNGFAYDIQLFNSSTTPGNVLVVTTMDPPGPPMGCGNLVSINTNIGAINATAQVTDPNNSFRLNKPQAVLDDIAAEYGYVPFQ